MSSTQITLFAKEILMPRGTAKKVIKRGEVNKAQAIRTTAKRLGKAFRPRDIVAALKKEGVTVGYSQIRKALRAGGFRKKAHAKKAAATAAAPSNGVAQINKAQRIRDVAKSLGKKVRPRDVIAELAKEGITVSSAQVSTTLAAAGYRRKRRGKKFAAAGNPADGNGLNLDALIAAKALVVKVGGIETAQEALSALKRLQ
jgi:lambda repressor-like predicted transcriptional regulator